MGCKYTTIIDLSILVSKLALKRRYESGKAVRLSQTDRPSTGLFRAAAAAAGFAKAPLTAAAIQAQRDQSGVPDLVLCQLDILFERWQNKRLDTSEFYVKIFVSWRSNRYE